MIPIVNAIKMPIPPKNGTGDLWALYSRGLSSAPKWFEAFMSQGIIRSAQNQDKMSIQGCGCCSLRIISICSIILLQSQGLSIFRVPVLPMFISISIIDKFGTKLSYCWGYFSGSYSWKISLMPAFSITSCRR